MTKEEAERMVKCLGVGKVKYEDDGYYCLSIKTRNGMILLGEEGWAFASKDGMMSSRQTNL